MPWACSEVIKCSSFGSSGSVGEERGGVTGSIRSERVGTGIMGSCGCAAGFQTFVEDADTQAELKEFWFSSVGQGTASTVQLVSEALVRNCVSVGGSSFPSSFTWLSFWSTSTGDGGSGECGFVFHVGRE